MSFYLTRNSLARLRIATLWLIRAFIKDLRRNYISFVSNLLSLGGLSKANEALAIQFNIAKPSKQDFLATKTIQQFFITNKPIIFASYCGGKHLPGYEKFCGGDKELNYLVKLLRERGYEAYIVTLDGNYKPWLLEHQPCISLDEFRRIVQQNATIRCVTSWVPATAFIQASPSLYFWDMELAHIEHGQFPDLAKLYRQKIVNTATISRTIQAWHMTYFRRSCTLLPNLVDQSLWFPLPEQRRSHRVGYMNEGSHTEAYIELIQEAVEVKGLNLEFHLIQGIESDVLAGMRSCEVFLTMNIGKDPLWGEGGPLPPLEAMTTGCIPIAFDIIGPREFIQSGFNGIVVPRYHPDLMAEALIDLYRRPEKRDYLRNNALALMQACHTFEARWSAVKEFLHL